MLRAWERLTRERRVGSGVVTPVGLLGLLITMSLVLGWMRFSRSAMLGR